MTLQLALDGAERGRSWSEALAIARAVRESVDVIEVGTSFILRDGLADVTALAREGWDKPVLADVKLLDAGAGLCAMTCGAGADIVTVMATAADATVAGVVREAHRRGCRVMADLLGAGDPVLAAARLGRLGADMVCLHVAVDAQSGAGGLNTARVAAVRAACGTMTLAAAGGITPETAGPLCRAGAEWLIVGGAVCNAPDPAAAAAAIRAAMNERGG